MLFNDNKFKTLKNTYKTETPKINQPDKVIGNELPCKWDATQTYV